jgi:hypothetical protein
LDAVVIRIGENLTDIFAQLNLILASFESIVNILNE